MYIFILGILVIAGCLAYIYVVNNKDAFVRKKDSGAHMYHEYDFDYDDEDEDEEEASPVIYLPDDIEQEKEKRKKRR